MKIAIAVEVDEVRIASLIPLVRMALYREAERRGLSVFDLLATLVARGVRR